MPRTDDERPEVHVIKRQGGKPDSGVADRAKVHCAKRCLTPSRTCSFSAQCSSLTGGLYSSPGSVRESTVTISVCPGREDGDCGEPQMQGALGTGSNWRIGKIDHIRLTTYTVEEGSCARSTPTLFEMCDLYCYEIPLRLKCKIYIRLTFSSTRLRLESPRLQS